MTDAMLGGGLSWGVRDSFIGYVEGVGGGAVSVGAGARRDGARMFSWPLRDAGGFDVGAGVGVLRFAGEVAFTAHFGALELVLADPVLEVGADGEALLSVTTRDGSALPLAAARVRAVPAQPGHLAWVGERVALHPQATVQFGGAYPAHTPLEPFVAVLPAPTAASGVAENMTIANVDDTVHPG